MAHVFECGHDAYFVARRHSGKDRIRFLRSSRGQQLAKDIIAHAVELGALDHRDKAGRSLRCLFRRQADLAGNRQGSERMIACNHDDTHAGVAACGDRLRHFPMRRVHHGDESEKRQVVLNGLDFEMFRLMGDLAHGHRHYTVGLFGERPALAKDTRPFVRRHRNGVAMNP